MVGGRFALFTGIKVRLGSCAQAADGVCQAFCFLREQAGGDGRADGEDLVAAAVGVLAAVEQVQGRIAHICQRRFTRLAVFGELQVQNDRFLAAAGIAAALAGKEVAEAVFTAIGVVGSLVGILSFFSLK